MSNAVAQSLFNEARALLDAQRVAEACEKFSQSQRLDPSAGTLLNLAICHELQGKTASAWLEFGESWSTALRENRPDRVQLARERMAALEPRLSRLIVRSALTSEALLITLDGREIPSAALGLAVPIDPGEHVLEARSPGKEAFVHRLTIGPDATTTELEIPALQAAAPAPPKSPSSRRPAPERAPAAVPDAGAPRERSSLRRNGSYVLAATAITAAGAGTLFGVQALRFKKFSDQECPQERCSAQGAAWSRQASSSATLSNASFGAALLATGAAIYLWVSEPADAPRQATRRLPPAPSKLSWSLGPTDGFVAWRAEF